MTYPRAMEWSILAEHRENKYCSCSYNLHLVVDPGKSPSQMMQTGPLRCPCINLIMFLYKSVATCSIYRFARAFGKSLICREGLFARIQEQNNLPASPPQPETLFLSSVSSEEIQQISCFLIFKLYFFGCIFR